MHPETFFPVEPNSFLMMLSGMVTLVGYLAWAGKWREVREAAMASHASHMALQRLRTTYPACDYEQQLADIFVTVASLRSTSESFAIPRSHVIRSNERQNLQVVHGDDEDSQFMPA